MAQNKEKRTIAFAFELAYSLIGIAGITIGGGLWIDHRFGCEPWGILVGTTLGILSMFTYILKNVRS